MQCSIGTSHHRSKGVVQVYETPVTCHAQSQKLSGRIPIHKFLFDLPFRTSVFVLEEEEVLQFGLSLEIRDVTTNKFMAEIRSHFVCFGQPSHLEDQFSVDVEPRVSVISFAVDVTIIDQQFLVLTLRNPFELHVQVLTLGSLTFDALFGKTRSFVFEGVDISTHERCSVSSLNRDHRCRPS